MCTEPKNPLNELAAQALCAPSVAQRSMRTTRKAHSRSTAAQSARLRGGRWIVGAQRKTDPARAARRKFGAKIDNLAIKAPVCTCDPGSHSTVHMVFGERANLSERSEVFGLEVRFQCQIATPVSIFVLEFNCHSPSLRTPVAVKLHGSVHQKMYQKVF